MSELPGTPAATTRYLVLWRDTRGYEHLGTAYVTEGYSTTDDLAKMFEILHNNFSEIVDYSEIPMGMTR